MKTTGHSPQPSSVLAGGAQPGPSRYFSRLRAVITDSRQNEIRRATTLKYAWTFVGQPYRWGGDDPILGFDCSGLVIEALQASGVLPHRFDATAAVLANTLQTMGARKLEAPAAGAIVFYHGQDGHISHVELALDELHLLGAIGGGSSTEDLEDAAQANAFVKVRPYGYRAGRTTILDPFPSQGGAPMKLKTKAKAVAGDIVAIIAAAIGIIPGLFKKKPYTLWQWDPVRKAWIDQGTYSARACKKLRAELIRLGQDPATFTIMRKGAKPPAEGPK